MYTSDTKIKFVFIGFISGSKLEAEDGSYTQSQFDHDLNCTNSTSAAQLRAINLTRFIAGTISLAIVILILLFLLLYKAYTTTLQRLFVHLTIASSLHDACFVIEVEHQFDYYGQEQFCAVVGFLDAWTSIMVYLFILGITLYVLYMIYKQFRGDPFQNYRRLKIATECFFTILMVVLPLVYLWLPFINDTYGFGLVAVCWIQKLQKNCEVNPFSRVVYPEVGLIVVVCIVHVLSTLGLAVVFCRLAYKYRSMKHRHIKTVRDTFILMCFLLTSVVFDGNSLLFLVSDNIAKYIIEHYALWMLAAIGPPVSMLIYPFGFLFYLYSFKKFKWQSIKKAAAEWKVSCGCNGEQRCIHFGPKVKRAAPITKDLATVPSSHPAVVPSVSFFDVEYTGRFTELVQENQPLVSGISDTGYGSVVNEH